MGRRTLTQKRRHTTVREKPAISNADTASIALFIAALDRKIIECHEQAKKLGTSLY
jgi:hypothetical protein